MTQFDFTGIGDVLIAFVTSWLGAFTGLFSGLLAILTGGTGV